MSDVHGNYRCAGRFRNRVYLPCLPLESIAILIGIDWFSGMFRTLMNVDVDVMVGMLVSSKLGDLDRDVYNETKVVKY